MDRTDVTLGGVRLALETARTLEVVGMGDTEVRADVARLTAGEVTREQLLAECLDGDDDDLAGDWEDYVSSVVAAAASEEMARGWDFADGLVASEEMAQGAR